MGHLIILSADINCRWFYKVPFMEFCFKINDFCVCMGKFVSNLFLLIDFLSNTCQLGYERKSNCLNLYELNLIRSCINHAFCLFYWNATYNFTFLVFMTSLNMISRRLICPNHFAIYFKNCDVISGLSTSRHQLEQSCNRWRTSKRNSHCRRTT